MHHRSVHCRREIAIGRAAIIVTVLACLLAVGGMARSVLQSTGSHRWGTALAQSLFLVIVSFLIYGGLVYQLARLGHLHRLMRHRRAGEPELQRFFHSQLAPSVTVLVPSYREDPEVVRRTLLSAALQDYPRRRVVLLVDDPPTPRRLANIGLLAAARSLPEEIEESLRKPAELFTDLTFRQPAQQFRERAERLDEGAFDPGWPRPQDLLEEYERLANRFRAEVSSFERKRFVSLSHEP